MPYLLKGRNVLVTGGSRGLGSAVCAKFAAEGCHISINYLSNKTTADGLAELLRQKYSVKCCVVQGDAGNAADNSRLVQETVEHLGGIDIIVANAGWTRKTKPGDIYDLTHDEWNKCWSTNVMSHLQLMQAAKQIFEKNADGGVYLMTSSIAGISHMGSSIGYSVTKAAGLHLMKILASGVGAKLRINAILPGLLLTEWGQEFGPQVIDYLTNRSILKHETYLDDCAKVFVDLAQNTSITGQQIVIDSGLLQGPVL